MMSIGESALRFFMCTVFTGHCVFYQCEIQELLISATDKNRYPHCCCDVEGKIKDIRLRDTMWLTSNSSSTEYFITCSVVVQLRIGIIAETHSLEVTQPKVRKSKRVPEKHLFLLY
ncbi:unnamed protein product [Rangifer tarandus platyrhynchus]|uniref:Uncharacterized protein n=2 Tax=Rangifer tarandus platyrhynchus TaxID=3082113 RepID=A0AC59ZUA0_RANTA|nr:unnamed protein product [Rangifer tarandus platyrhynchus]